MWAHCTYNSVFFFLFVFLVGKTSLITRFMYDSFDNTYQVRPTPPSDLSTDYAHILQKSNINGLKMAVIIYLFFCVFRPQ